MKAKNKFPIKVAHDGECYVDIETNFGTRKFFLHTTDKEEARKKFAESKMEEMIHLKSSDLLRAEAYNILSLGRVLTVKEAIKDWRKTTDEELILSPNTMRAYYYRVVAWATNIRRMNSSPASITVKEITSWIYNENDKSMGGRENDLKAIRHFMEFMFSRGIIPHNPSRAISKVEPRRLKQHQCVVRERVLFTDDEIRRLLDYLDKEIAPLQAKAISRRPRVVTQSFKWMDMMATLSHHKFFRAAVVISRYSGMRIGDICNLQWSSLDRRPGCLMFRASKTGSEIVVPLRMFNSTELEKTISGLERNNTLYCFPRQQAINANPNDKSRIQRLFKTRMDAAGIKNHNFHDLRATFISYCIDNEMPISRVAEVVGHSYVGTTRGYIPLQQQAAKLPEGIEYVQAQEVIEAHEEDAELPARSLAAV